MSIYPVRISEWFPPTDEMHDNTYGVVMSSRCNACYSKVRWQSAVAHHSIGFGYGDVWCNWKCCYSRKQGLPDKRQLRTIKRRGKYTNLYSNVALTFNVENKS